MSEPAVLAVVSDVDEAELKRHPVLDSLWHHWREAHDGAEGRPHRAAIDPLRLPPAAWPHCFLLDALEDDFRVRLYGTYAVDLMGRDPTGRRVGPMTRRTAAEGGEPHPALHRLMRERRPVLWRHLAHLRRERKLTLMLTLLLPLFCTQGHVEMVFGGVVVPDAETEPESGWSTEKRREFVKEIFARGHYEGVTAEGHYRIVLR